MRKIICLALCLSMVALFTACGNDEDTTSANAFEYYTPDSTTIENATEQVDGTNIYILTTDESFEIPIIVTTTFNVDSIEVITSTIDATATTTSSTTMGSVVITTANTTVPAVATSVITTTASSDSSATTTTSSGSSSDSDSVTTTTATTTTTTTTTAEETTTASTATEKTLVISSINYDASAGKIYAYVDTTGWNSSFLVNSTSITVTDNDSIIGYANCSILTGGTTITIDVSGLNITSDSMLKFTIPSSFLKTTDGSQYSSSYTPSGYLSS